MLIVFFSSRISPLASAVILRREVAAGHGGGHLGDVADLGREVGGHRVHRVGEVLPRARHAGHRALSAELAVGAHFACHARDFRREGIELIDHRVDRVLQLQNLALGVGGDLPRKVSRGDGRSHFGDIADLGRKVRGHRVHRVGKVLPRAGHAGHFALAAEPPFGADFAGDAA